MASGGFKDYFKTLGVERTASELEIISEEDYDKLVIPKDMTHP